MAATKTKRAEKPKPAAPPLPKWAESAASIRSRWLDACRQSHRWEMIFWGQDSLNLGDRLERLLAVAFCRDIWPLLTDPRSRGAVEVAERFADGLATNAERSDADAAAASAASDAAASAASDAAASAAYAYAADAAASAAYAYAADAAYAAAYAYAADAAYAAAYAADADAAAAAAADAAADAASDAAAAAAAADRQKVREEKWSLHGELLVCVVGPGWEFDPSWRTQTAVLMARGMYESRDFSPMPILADAIQDAGCEEAVLLDAMRDPSGVWCRGARILDCLLEKR